MTHTFEISGMKCGSCVKRVQKALSEVKGVENVNVTLNPPEAEIRMHDHIDKNIFNAALKNIGDYELSETKSSDV